MGCTSEMQVPDGDRLAFAIIQHGPVEIMYQTLASIEKEDPALLKNITVGTTFLFLEVSNIDDIIPLLSEADIVKPRHDTFYGMAEVTIREPGGQMVTFASPIEKKTK